FELKRAAAVENHPDLTETLPDVMRTRTNGEPQFVISEILSSRFSALSLVSAHGDIALYQGRNLKAGADDGLVSVRVFQGKTDELSQLELFRHEAFAAAKLSHPNILTSNSPEVIDGVHFSTFQHRPDAETLKSLLNREGWLDLAVAMRIVSQIADAIDYAHRNGVLHLRINPENILIERDGTALLCDFGINAGSQFSWAHKERSMRGPIHYASPEQATDKPIDCRTDLYSLGVVVYQMLTDRLPIDSESPDKVKQKHVTQTPLAPHFYSPDIPSSLSAVITRLLEKDPNQRFQDVASFRAAMNNSIGEQDSSASTARLTADTAPIEPEHLLRDYRLEAWEPPSITVMNPPVDDVLALDLEIDVSPDTQPLVEPSPPAEQTERQSASLIFNQATSEAGSNSQLRPILLIVVLAIATVGGLIVLARANRNKPPTRSTAESISTDKSHESGSSHPLISPSVDRTPDISPGVSRESVSNPKHDSAHPKTIRGHLKDGTIASRAAIRSRQSASRSSSRLRRPRQVKRKSWRPTQYFRHSR
ncbi:MAG: serine/threonine-protein kinase, partial [Blastocatellia bacterium]